MNTPCTCIKCDPIISVQITRIHKRLNESIAQLQLHIIHIESVAQAEVLESKITQLTNQLQNLGRTHAFACQEARPQLQ